MSVTSGSVKIKVFVFDFVPYGKLLASCFLCFDVSPNRIVRHISGCAYKVAACPKSIRLDDVGKLLKQRPRCIGLNDTHYIGRTYVWRYIQKQMTMIDMTFHGQNIKAILLANLAYQLFKSGLNAIYEKYFSAIARTKHKMIVYHRNGCCGSSVLSYHVSYYIIL